MKGGRKTALLLALLLAAQLLLALPAAGAEISEPAAMTAAAASAGSGTRMLVMPSSLTEIDEEAFAGTAAEHVLLSDRVEILADRAFDGMQGLVSVYLPASLRSAGRAVFGETGRTMLLGGAETFAETWAGEARYSFSRARVRRTELRTRNESERLLLRRGDSLKEPEEDEEKASPAPRIRAAGIREVRPLRRGDRAEMNHLVGLFP